MTITINGTTGITAPSLTAVGALTGGSETLTAPLPVASGGSGQVGALTVYSPAVTPLPTAGVTASYAHGLGINPVDAAFEITCLTAEYGYSIGDKVVNPVSNNVSTYTSQTWSNSTSVGIVFPGTIVVANKSTGAGNATTAANWSYRFKMRTY